MKFGIIAGNGRFPVIALETARRQGDEAVAIAIKEEASPEVERAALRCHWVSRRSARLWADSPASTWAPARC